MVFLIITMFNLHHIFSLMLCILSKSEKEEIKLNTLIIIINELRKCYQFNQCYENRHI